MKSSLLILIAMAMISQSAFAEIRSLSVKEQGVVARTVAAIIPSIVKGDSDTTIENCQVSNEDENGKQVKAQISCRYSIAGTASGTVKPINLELLLNEVVITKGEVTSAEFKSLSK